MPPGYRQYQPCPALASFIECYWVLNSPQGFLQGEERLIPGGRVELIFNFGDAFHWLSDQETQSPFRDNQPPAQIMGQRDRIFYARTTGLTRLLGVRFRAGGISVFTNLPADHLLNKMTPAESVFGPIADQWTGRLADAGEERQQIQILDKLLLQTLLPLPDNWHPLQNILNNIRSQPSPPAIDDICRQTGWNYRRLERTFLRSVGYSPKNYARVVRFNQTLRLIKGGTRQSLTAIAYECGYFDQAHFIKDFRQFAGTTPGRFAAEKHAIADLLIRWQPV